MLLEQILESENLQLAWKRVKQNKGVAGLTIDHYLEWGQKSIGEQSIKD